MSVRVDFRWPEDLVEQIDRERGDVPRSTFVRRVVEGYLGLPEMSPTEIPKVDAKKVIAPSVERVIDEAKALGVEVKPAGEVRFGCRVPDCDFTAGSPSANCPSHPGKLVLV
jgi:hypothetical protein